MELGFNDWQTQLNGKIAHQPGFVSLEITSPQGDQSHWSIIQRFLDEKSCKEWKDSGIYQRLQNDLRKLAKDSKETLTSPGLVTEVFLTVVNPENEKSYREWLAKIHDAEARFPGFRGMFVQSPTDPKNKKWVTCLQFDTPENLDKWLTSPEREAILKELNPLILSLESHRVFSPYAGWFSALQKEGFAPPLWKQTMLVLLVLFPIVMLEMKFLNPQLITLPSAIAVFIGNLISVSLISWVTMPVAIYFLRDWLTSQTLRMDILGTLLVIALYALEIVLLWGILT